MPRGAEMPALFTSRPPNLMPKRIASDTLRIVRSPSGSSPSQHFVLPVEALPLHLMPLVGAWGHSPHGSTWRSLCALSFIWSAIQAASRLSRIPSRQCRLPRLCARSKTALRAAGPLTSHKARASVWRASISRAVRPIRHHLRTSHSDYPQRSGYNLRSAVLQASELVDRATTDAR